MKTTIKIIKNVLYLLLFSLIFSSIVEAQEIDDLNVNYDSMYRYNSLENKAPLPDFTVVKDTYSASETSPAVELEEDISQKLQEITIKHEFSKNKIDNTINIINKRSELRTFLTGNSLGILRFQTVQMKDYITDLNILNLKTEDGATKIIIDNQIKSLQEEEKMIESFINKQGNKFNMFGWFVTIL